MSSLFEAGPWDNAEAVAGVHVFDKKRKLLYGDEHDRAAHAEDPSAYSAPREEHRLHPLWPVSYTHLTLPTICSV